MHLTIYSYLEFSSMTFLSLFSPRWNSFLFLAAQQTQGSPAYCIFSWPDQLPRAEVSPGQGPLEPSAHFLLFSSTCSCLGKALALDWRILGAWRPAICSALQLCPILWFYSLVPGASLVCLLQPGLLQAWQNPAWDTAERDTPEREGAG